MTRDDTHVAIVMNHSTGARASLTGSKKDVERQAEEQKKVWKGSKLEVLIEKRAP